MQTREEHNTPIKNGTFFQGNMNKESLFQSLLLLIYIIKQS